MVQPDRPMEQMGIQPPAPEAGEAARPDPGVTLDELWKRALSRESSLKIRKLLAGTSPIERRAGVIVVSLQEEIRHLLDLSKGALETVLGRELGEAVRLEVQAPDPASRARAESAGPEPESERADDFEAAERNPLVRTTMELFDAEIVEIKPRQRTGR